MTRMVQTHDIDGKTYDVSADTLIWNPAVYGVIVRDGTVFLMQVGDKYSLPGGSIEPGEDHVAALQREIAEETGMTVQPTRLLNVYTSLYHSFKADKNYHCIQLIYICELVAESGTPTLTADEQKYLKPGQWVKISDLNKLPYVGTEPVFTDIQHATREI